MMPAVTGCDGEKGIMASDSRRQDYWEAGRGGCSGGPAWDFLMLMLSCPVATHYCYYKDTTTVLDECPAASREQ